MGEGPPCRRTLWRHRLGQQGFFGRLLFMFVRAGTIASGDGDIQQPEEYAQLRAMVDDLAIGIGIFSAGQ